MKKFVLFGLVLLVAGCANLAQTGSVSKAYETYEHGKYEEMLKMITQAENFSTVTRELKAELTYLRAQTYRKLNQHEKADTLFKYLKDKHQDSQYGYLAAKRLEQ
jgi:Flp pilus assembly protein TadD